MFVLLYLHYIHMYGSKWFRLEIRREILNAVKDILQYYDI